VNKSETSGNKARISDMAEYGGRCGVSQSVVVGVGGQSQPPQRQPAVMKENTQ
jgi:hypothetical protein